ncbi:MAG: hypothetical protein R8J84_02365 [Mariprofundales bacterium]
MSIEPLSFQELPVVAMAQQQVRCDESDFAGVHRSGASFSDFLCTLPNLGAAAELIHMRDALMQAHRASAGILFSCGGGALTHGLSPMLAQLIARKLFSSLALTGSALVKDVEIALSGTIFVGNGDQGVTEESCRLINEAIDWAAEESIGIGASVGKKLLDCDAPHREHSLLACAAQYGIPLTVHPAIGADAFHRHPALRGESLGAAGLHDFRLLAALVGQCNHGVILNVASSVVMPSLLSEAATAVRSSGRALDGITTMMLDSSVANVVAQEGLGRLAAEHGNTYWMRGAVEILLPLLMASVVEAL